MPQRFDNLSHRLNRNYQPSVFVRRLLWACLEPLFALSPRPCYAWRNALLRLAGAQIGEACRFYPNVRITFPWNLRTGDFVTVAWDVRLYCLGRVSLGSHVLISQGVHICAGTHDITRPNLPLLCPPITIGSHCWICADAFIGPDLSIGEASLVGARSVVLRDIPAGKIAVGHPARPIGDWQMSAS